MAAVVNETVDGGWLAFLRRIGRDNELDTAGANISERTGDVAAQFDIISGLLSALNEALFINLVAYFFIIN